jgi:hypothetical protein
MRKVDRETTLGNEDPDVFKRQKRVWKGEDGGEAVGDENDYESTGQRYLSMDVAMLLLVSSSVPERLFQICPLTLGAAAARKG